MNGMVPYVDFTDSKGPLLWLIYGVGYLISHHSYVGVFWISVLFYTVTLFAAYKLCLLFVEKDVAAMSTVALPFFLFFFLIHPEVNEEDYCYSFIMISLYCLCRILKYRDSDARTYFKLSALMGVCSMCCALIKYNIGCMIMGLMAVVLYMAIRHKAGWQSFAGMALGFVVPAIPFVICFLIYGNMGAFIQEYFLNTFETIKNISKDVIITHQIRTIIKVCILLGIMIWGICRVSRKHKLGYWLIPCVLLFIVGLGKNFVDATYYLIIMPFFIFFLLTIIEFILCKTPRLCQFRKMVCAVTVIAIISINMFSILRFAFDDNARANYYKAAYVMSQMEKPTLMWYSAVDFGVGTPAGILPACRYWICQNGATGEMIKEREYDLENGVPDFVCILLPNKEDRMKVFEERKERIESYGYVFYCKSPVYRSKSPSNMFVYGRPGLRLPPEDFHVSQWDVWLKRNIFGI